MINSYKCAMNQPELDHLRRVRQLLEENNILKRELECLIRKNKDDIENKFKKKLEGIGASKSVKKMKTENAIRPKSPINISRSLRPQNPILSNKTKNGI